MRSPKILFLLVTLIASLAADFKSPLAQSAANRYVASIAKIEAEAARQKNAAQVKYLAELKSALAVETKAGHFDEAIKVKTEINKIEAAEVEKPPAKIPGGTYSVSYPNGVNRIYHLEPNGVMYWVENGTKTPLGTILIANNGDIVSNLPEKAEMQRWTFAATHVVVENYYEPAAIKGLPKIIGVGELATPER